MDNLDLLRFVDQTLDLTRRIIQEETARGLDTKLKSDKSVVTQIDLRIERLFRDRVAAAFPGHGVLGEEFESTQTDDGAPCWVIDPIDGTLSLTRGIPTYGTIIALKVAGVAVVGALDLPGVNQRIAGARGHGAWLNGQPFRYQAPAYDRHLKMIGTGDRLQFRTAGLMRQLAELQDEFEYVRTYTDVFGHLLALTGRISLMIDPSLRAWDEAATGVIAEAAGCGFAGLNARVGADGAARRDIVVGDPELVAEFTPRLGA
jgi:fructose-1,6-bisphosphatase/inositol monophosphatase family enzyme